MTPDQQTAIADFFKAAARLEELEVIRSSRFLGDIGEFLCESAFAVTLADQLRQTGHDGTDHSGRVQIKFNNSIKGNNINVGNPNKFETLLVVIGPKSKLREIDHDPCEFRLYRYTRDEVHQWKSPSNNYYCAKKQLIECIAKAAVTVF